MTDTETVSPAAPRSDLQLVAGLPPDEVERHLQDANRTTDLGHRMLAFYLHELQERRLYQLSGHAGAVHYATAALGMSRRRARQLVNAGRMLTDLKGVDAAFCRGDLSWSKVRLLTDVAVPATETAWIQRAGEICCRGLEHEVGMTERGQPPRRGNQGGLPAVRFQVRAFLDAVGHAQWEKARQRLREELGREVTDEDVLRHLTESYLTGRGAHSSSAYQVIVRQCPDCADAAVETEEGPVPIDKTEAAMVACDGERVGLEPNVDQPTPAWLRRGVLARDGGRCASCRSPRSLMVHHIQFRSRGGTTRAENLVTLCARCHALVHEGLLRTEGTGAKDLRFVRGREGPVENPGGGTRGPPEPENRQVGKARTGRFALRP